MPEFFISRLINLLSLGSVQSAIPVSTTVNEDVNNCNNSSEDFNTNGLYHHNSIDHHSSVSHSGINFSKGLGRAVRQMSLVTSLPQDELMNESLGWDIDLDRLRRLTFRENFARLCFGKLLSHAFSAPSDVRLSSTISTPVLLENGHVGNNNGYKIGPSSTNFSLMVSKTAVRSILQRCRSVLLKFYQSSRLIGKCPLPR